MRLAIVPFAAFLLATMSACDERAPAQDSRPNDPGPGIHQFEMKRIDGKLQKLSDYEGKVTLVVNVASECGYTPQYEGLQKLYEKYSDRGFTILGFPCNDFGAQEPGTDESIFDFCNQTYGVKFPLFSKIAVVGPNACPLYRYLQTESPMKATVKWNFHKFVVDREGHVVATFGSRVTPADPKLATAIEAALAKGAVESKPAVKPGGVQFLILAKPGMPLSDGSKLDAADEARKQRESAQGGKPYLAPAPLRWVPWSQARTERNGHDGELVLFDPEFWGDGKTGFTEKSLADVRPSVDRLGQRVIAISVKKDAQDAFAKYTERYVDWNIATVVDGEIIGAPVINTPLRDAMVLSCSGGFSESEQKALIERLRPPN